MSRESEGIGNTCECPHVQCCECSNYGEVTTCFHCIGGRQTRRRHSRDRHPIATTMVSTTANTALKGRVGANIPLMRREEGQKVASPSRGHANVPMGESAYTRLKGIPIPIVVFTATRMGKRDLPTALAHAVAATKKVKDGRPRAVKANLKRRYKERK